MQFKSFEQALAFALNQSRLEIGKSDANHYISIGSDDRLYYVSTSRESHGTFYSTTNCDWKSGFDFWEIQKIERFSPATVQEIKSKINIMEDVLGGNYVEFALSFYYFDTSLAEIRDMAELAIAILLWELNFVFEFTKEVAQKMRLCDRFIGVRKSLSRIPTTTEPDEDRKYIVVGEKKIEGHKKLLVVAFNGSEFNANLMQAARLDSLEKGEQVIALYGNPSIANLRVEAV